MRSGCLTLTDLAGSPLSAPQVVYARLSTPGLGTDAEVTLLRQLHAMGSRLVNPIDAVLACVNKFWHLQQLAQAGIPVPDTHTYTSADLHDVLDSGIPEPCVIKGVRGHRGRRVFLAPTRAMLRDVASSLAEDVPYLFQRYIAYSHARDLRVIVVDNRAVTAQLRTGNGDTLKSNLALGGTATPCLGTYPAGEALAERAAHALGLGVAGVDLLFEEDGTFTVCEVNANVTWQQSHDSAVLQAIVAACQARLGTASPPVPLPARSYTG
ncbi:RimK family alpha-L-glutamate ligase [Streptomyces flavidovirens]|uniref:RimK family alpha-L-glutamate ligase n=1 Tax=Streptomyces flavidovirens TaxID=67298 RepID=UPI003416A46F